MQDLMAQITTILHTRTMQTEELKTRPLQIERSHQDDNEGHHECDRKHERDRGHAHDWSRRRHRRDEHDNDTYLDS